MVVGLPRHSRHSSRSARRGLGSSLAGACPERAPELLRRLVVAHGGVGAGEPAEAGELEVDRCFGPLVVVVEVGDATVWIFCGDVGPADGEVDEASVDGGGLGIGEDGGKVAGHDALELARASLEAEDSQQLAERPAGMRRPEDAKPSLDGGLGEGSCTGPVARRRHGACTRAEDHQIAVVSVLSRRRGWRWHDRRRRGCRVTGRRRVIGPRGRRVVGGGGVAEPRARRHRARGERRAGQDAVR